MGQKYGNAEMEKLSIKMLRIGVVFSSFSKKDIIIRRKE